MVVYYRSVIATMATALFATFTFVAVATAENLRGVPEYTLDEPEIKNSVLVQALMNDTLDVERSLATATLPDFCWKDSYGRGVGLIPEGCSAGREKIGLLCYTTCPAGYYRWGFDCHQYCPTAAGWADQGLFCRLVEYGRGGGYPWWFGDCLCNDGMINRCEAANGGKGTCEMWGAIAYPKCRPGYYAFGCCICRPITPNCAALGMGGNFDISCAKKIIIGDPVPMTVCPNCLSMDAGLCYTPCKKGYHGLGPVCWGQPPTGMVHCGMGAAKNDVACGLVIADQLMSVGQVATFIATLGGSGPLNIVKGTAQYTQLAAKYSTNLQKFKEVAQGFSFVKQRYDNYVAVSGTVNIIETSTEPVDFVRASATMMSLVDPSGVSGVVAAYAYGQCSLYVGTTTLEFYQTHGLLTQLSADMSGAIWGVNSDNAVFYRKDLSSGWQHDGVLRYVTVSGDGNHVYGLSSTGVVWYRNGMQGGWSINNGVLATISVSNDGKHVWGTDSQGNIYYRNGVSGSWVGIPGNLKQLKVSGDGMHVWGVTFGGNIYYRKGLGGTWVLYDGMLAQIDVNYDGSMVWGVNKDGSAFYRAGSCGSGWVHNPGPLFKYIAVSGNANYVYGLDYSNRLWYQSSI